MNATVRQLTDSLLTIVSAWPQVECVSLNEAARTDVLDSYFALVFDVYYKDSLPSVEDRKAKFVGAQVFETSPVGSKDRFLMNGIPVRMEYKNILKVEETVSVASGPKENLWHIKDSGTYGFYRLLEGEVLYQKSSWIDNICHMLKKLPEDFWVTMRGFYQTTMEHYLMDLGAAVVQNDSFNYLVSSSGFIKSACAVLFMINHRFEPSHKAFNTKIQELKILPEGFYGWFESFLRSDETLSSSRKYTIAQQLAKTIMHL